MLAEFIGQAEARANLAVFIESARNAGRGDGPYAVPWAAGPGEDDAGADHGAGAGGGVPDDLGSRAGEARRPGGDPDEPGAADVLFIDEIHRLSPVVEEVLYPRWRISRWIW